MIEKIGHAKKTPEVLTEVFTKLSYVLILDLPDFIRKRPLNTPYEFVL